ncbi:MATE family efflux transporter [Solitalea koreensis]|nr:hypothetical protein [Solitalea koreensis]
MLYTILNLYLGANFLFPKDFLILQQITLFQSFLLFAISLPVGSIFIRLGNSNLEYFKTLIGGTVLFRGLIGTLSILVFNVYLHYAGYAISDIGTIALGLLPTLISSVFFIDIIPHIFNFEGRKNWELITVYSLFFIVKCLTIIVFKSICLKILIEFFESIVLVFWVNLTYLKGIFQFSLIKSSFKRLLKMIRFSTGLYLNGILSVFILRIDQFVLINFIDKSTLSKYMLIVSISSLFLIPMTLLGERLAFTITMAKTQSKAIFKEKSVKSLLTFTLLSLVLYIIFAGIFTHVSSIFFKRNLDDLFIVGLILGFSIVSNSIGMVLGQINTTINDGVYTMKRSFIGCICMFIGVNIGFKLYGIIGVAIAASFTLFLTNILFWFFSERIREVLFYHPVQKNIMSLKEQSN